jgi:hypothetical protein
MLRALLVLGAIASVAIAFLGIALLAGGHALFGALASFFRKRRRSSEKGQSQSGHGKSQDSAHSFESPLFILNNKSGFVPTYFLG